MAHFAELDSNNKVIRVIVISNDETHDENGIEQEELGIKFCQSLYGPNTKWVQTSYNANFRNKYAGIGWFYDSEKDIFIEPEPIEIVIPNAPKEINSPNA